MKDKAVYDQFEWDPDKEKSNILQHHVDFITASKAFDDPNGIIKQDESHSLTEVRWLCLGKVESEIVTVRFTYRGIYIRIIGAGKWRKGRKEYEKENTQTR